MTILDLDKTQKLKLYMAIGLIEEIMREQNDNCLTTHVNQKDKDGTKWIWKISITKTKSL